jgi:hypothetical protein
VLLRVGDLSEEEIRTRVVDEDLSLLDAEEERAALPMNFLPERDGLQEGR